MKNRNFILVVVSILSASIILTGCYSYRPITNDQLLSQNGHNKLKFVLNDQNEIIVNEEDKLNTSNPDMIVITKIDSTQIVLDYDEVNSLLEERFDLNKSFFATFWILVGLIAILAFLAGPKLKAG